MREGRGDETEAFHGPTGFAGKGENERPFNHGPKSP